MSIPKLAIIVSHPIQHFCPQYVSWERLGGMEMRVFFASRHGLDSYYDADFQGQVQWRSVRLNFPHVFLPGAATRDLGSELDCPALIDRLGEFAPDIVLVYGYAQPLQRRAMAWAKARKKQVVLIGDSELHQRRSALKRLVKRALLPRMFRKVDAFLTVGDSNDAYYRAYGVPDHKLIRSFFPIDIEVFDEAFAHRELYRARVRRMLGLPEDHVVFLSVGKFVTWKRQKDLVVVANRLKFVCDKCTIVLAGTGPEGDTLHSMAEVRGAGGVVFAGFVPPEELTQYYAAADVYVHCASSEPHSLAISEAIYMGLPAIVSDRTGSYGPTDDVRVGLNGYVYQCGDVRELERLLRLFAQDRGLRDSFGAESRKIGLRNQQLAHNEAIVQVLHALQIKGAL